MPGCLDRCYLYREYHSIEYADDVIQKKIEEELEKYEKGESYDITWLKSIVKRMCLGNHLKDPENLPTECKHYSERAEDLSVEEQAGISARQADKKWKVLSVIIGIAGVLTASLFAYLNYSKPSSEDLKKEISTLKMQTLKYEQEMRVKNGTIDSLRIELQSKDTTEDKK